MWGVYVCLCLVVYVLVFLIPVSVNICVSDNNSLVTAVLFCLGAVFLPV